MLFNIQSASRADMSAKCSSGHNLKGEVGRISGSLMWYCLIDRQVSCQLMSNIGQILDKQLYLYQSSCYKVAAEHP